MQKLFLKKHEDRRLRAGHLWIFSNEVDTARSPLAGFFPGESATVCDAGGRALGTAYVNPASLIAARLVSHQPGVPLDATLLRDRLRHALTLRERLFSEPWYRLCHGEGDALPGLVADRYGDVLCLQISTAGMEVCKDDLLEVLTDLLRPSAILLRNDLAARALEGLPQTVATPLGSVPEEVEIRESNAIFHVSLTTGQKTGWFYDQRRNRQEAARYATGARVLDAFCYVGGFGVMAARNNARSVTFLDASAAALARAARNLADNAKTCSVELAEGDALHALADLREADQRFDIVCLDPPAFIKRRKDAEQGLAAYRRINDLGVQLVADGGILVTCSCSHHLEAEALLRLVSRSCSRRGLRAQLLHQGFQAPDHPVHAAMPETAYLKCFIFRIRR